METLKDVHIGHLPRQETLYNTVFSSG